MSTFPQSFTSYSPNKPPGYDLETNRKEIVITATAAMTVRTVDSGSASLGSMTCSALLWPSVASADALTYRGAARHAAPAPFNPTIRPHCMLSRGRIVPSKAISVASSPPHHPQGGLP